MPRNRQSDDLDHVLPDPQPSSPARKPPPTPWALPEYEPMQIKRSYRNGIYNLPSHVAIDSPYVIFSLFFDYYILRKLAKHTNQYAELPGQIPRSPSMEEYYMERTHTKD